jgi:hypothetical protein
MTMRQPVAFRNSESVWKETRGFTGKKQAKPVESSLPVTKELLGLSLGDATTSLNDAAIIQAICR